MGRGKSIGRALLVSTACVLLAVPVARAASSVVAGPPNRYFVSEATIDQGGSVSFNNYDTVTHDVTARGRAPDGSPLFRSEYTGAGGSANVDGTQYLTSGDYAFICSIHPDMQGTLHVTSAGTPAARPGGGGGGAGGGGRAASDTHPPTVSMKLLDARLSKVKKRRLRVRVTSDEAATVEISARAGRTTLGRATAKFGRAGSLTVSLKLTRKGLRAVRHSRKLRVSLSSFGKDSVGNSDTTQTAKTLRR